MARLSVSNPGNMQGAGISLGKKPSTAPIREAETSSASVLRDALSKIEQVSRVLRRFSVIILSTTIISLGLLFTALLVGEGLNWLAVGSLLTGCLALYGCASHEIWRKRGDVLFEEISDEVERRVVTDAGEPVFEGESDLLPRTKLALRDFVHASDLPFIPGKFGPTTYAVLNLLIPILILFSSRLLRP